MSPPSLPLSHTDSKRLTVEREAGRETLECTDSLSPLCRTEEHLQVLRVKNINIIFLSVCSFTAVSRKKKFRLTALLVFQLLLI